ncbi:MAG: DUF4166 domain-containing protein [Parasphingorhabdus sp.]|uniref:DUF4166 domain-containing protein n=1 Tax=Parasphingorhabdus sp. TaxID=2709688 RepID=UPI0032977F29
MLASRSGISGSHAVKKILILGGYGGFGARLSQELASRGYHILVAGRGFQKAKLFCETIENTEPLQADRNGDIGEIIERHKPDLLIDAAGPFQGSNYKLVEQCIALATPYLDLADGRDFVCGIGTLNDAATAAGISVISGASSVPALSGAAIRHLASEVDQIEAIEMAISASNKATAGPSVSKAILSYVGKPIRVRRAGQWQTSYGWHDLRDVRFTLPDGSAVGPRLVGLADVPDLHLVPTQFDNKPTVIFRAGTELRFQNRVLWLASWPVRWGWIKSLVPFAPGFLSLQNITRALGSDISAMKVELCGHTNDQPNQKDWTLIARNGDGPQIPTFAAILLAEKILFGQIEFGAYDASKLLELSEFQPLFDRYAIAHATQTVAAQPSLYRKVMGQDFKKLPASLEKLHTVIRDAGFHGEAEVSRGKNPLAGLAAKIFGFPAAGKHDLHVHIKVDSKGETWTRSFSGKKFSSRLQKTDRHLTENFGLFQFRFHLPVTDNGLAMEMAGWKFWFIPLPLFLAPKSQASEWEEDGRFHFDVPIKLPLVGLMVHYRGWLKPIRN